MYYDKNIYLSYLGYTSYYEIHLSKFDWNRILDNLPIVVPRQRAYGTIITSYEPSLSLGFKSSYVAVSQDAFPMQLSSQKPIYLDPNCLSNVESRVFIL